MIKVIDVAEIKHCGINRRSVGRTILTQEYKDYKKMLHYMVKKDARVKKLDKPYAVNIFISSAHDIDAPIKPILDSLEGTVIENDKDVMELHVYRKAIKRGHAGSLRVEIGECNELFTMLETEIERIENTSFTNDYEKGFLEGRVDLINKILDFYRGEE